MIYSHQHYHSLFQDRGLEFLEADEGSLVLRLHTAHLNGELAPGGTDAQAPSTSPAAGGVVLGEDGKPLSKNALKKLAKPKKEKKQNNWDVNEEKKAAKAKEKAEKAEAAAKRSAAEAAAQVATPKGEKKILTKDMASVYHPALVEASWQEWWENSGYYSADAQAGAEAGPDGRFVIVIPPPNVTGSLHLGHALTAAIEDTLTRWHRMKGDVTLYVPGTDHAGIATQSVVEKKLMKEEGKTRHDYGRPEFLKKVWEWKEQYGSRICTQIRELGSSVDWSREAFTMDDKCSRAVVEAFCRFHEKGILFRDKRLINWSCRLKSAISDIEVDYEDIEGGTMRAVPGHTKRPKYEFGMFTEFAYKVEGSDEEIVVATTRLETMLGDTAVAVHPKDPRYKHLHGKCVVHPFHPTRRVPIVLDDVLVDMALGTGAVKITPAHDPNDYECGKRHNLPFITIFTPDGSVNEEGGKLFEGMMRYDARIAVEEELKKLGLLRSKYPKPMKLGFCSRSGDVIEPMIMPQWFVDCADMAARSVAAVREGRLNIRPAFHEKTWYQWLENIRPWCVSRQLWWGHRIPAYFATTKAEEASKGSPSYPDRNSDKGKHRWVVARSESDARAAAAKVLGVRPGEVHLEQDEDVLDTWFSSGLFPFSTMGWPDESADMAGFFPTSLLETGLDILFFWVARMVMMSLQLTDQLPFTDVYLHAMVRDKEGRKMSKSLGNVIDPLEVIHGCELAALQAKVEGGNLPSKEVAKAKKDFEVDFGETNGIPKCGADALRIGLLAYTVQGRDIHLDIKRVVGYRNFCNKLWQATRFMLGCFGDFVPFKGMGSGSSARGSAAAACAEDEAAAQNELVKGQYSAPRDRWILRKLNEAVGEVGKCFAEYEFGKCVQVLDTFLRGKLCDVYLELIKPNVYSKESTPQSEGLRNHARAVLWTCLDTGLRLLHPICPFVTEELWQRLPGRGAGALANEPASIMIAKWPTPVPAFAAGDASGGGGGGGGLDARMAAVLGAVEGARSLRSDHHLLKKPAPFVLVCSSADSQAALSEQSDDFATLALAATVDVVGAADPRLEQRTQGWPLKIVSDSVKVFVDANSVKAAAGGSGGGADNSVQLKKLRKDIATLEPLVKKLQGKMATPAYLSKVPEATQAKDRDKLEQYSKQLADARDALSKLEE